jgi:hypothetical protein
MSLGFRAESTNTSGVITVAGVDQVVINNAGNVAATTFTGALVGNASTATALSTATGAAPVYGVRAWVSFDGTKDTSGAASSANTARYILQPNGSGNVTSVLRTSTGNYTINFSTALPNASYSVVYSTSAATPGTYFTRPYIFPNTRTTTSVAVYNLTEVSTNADPIDNNIIVIG